MLASEMENFGNLSDKKINPFHKRKTFVLKLEKEKKKDIQASLSLPLIFEI